MKYDNLTKPELLMCLKIQIPNVDIELIRTIYRKAELEELKILCREYLVKRKAHLKLV